MQNNTLVLFDTVSKKGFLFDPSFQVQPIKNFIIENSITIEMILCTHGHFDHFAGVPYFSETLSSHPPVAFCKKDLALWQDGGGSKHFHYDMHLPKDPDKYLVHGDVLSLGEDNIEIREVPGHSSGSLIFYVPSLAIAICGDAIFHESIGRTDLEDGDYDLLIQSIKTQILSLPDNTQLIPGHGEVTTVSHEKAHNPYLAG